MQGKLDEIKMKYSTEEYHLEAESNEDALTIQQAFPEMKMLDETHLTFFENGFTVFDVLRFVTDKRINLLKIERVKPSLESLFMEVVKE